MNLFSKKKEKGKSSISLQISMREAGGGPEREEIGMTPLSVRCQIQHIVSRVASFTSLQINSQLSYVCICVTYHLRHFYARDVSMQCSLSGSVSEVMHRRIWTGYVCMSMKYSCRKYSEL